MRGHWLSSTRKLNRHYQSGGGNGGPALTYGEFYLANAGIAPHTHDTDGREKPYASGLGEYYDLPYTYDSNVMSQYLTQNFARAFHMIGRHNKDNGCYVWGRTTEEQPVYGSGTPFSTWYWNQIENKKISRSLYSAFSSDGQPITEYDLRYVKFIYPKYYYSPAFYKGYEIKDENTFSMYDNQAFPETGYQMDSKACKAAWNPYTGRTITVTQMATVKQKYTRNGSGSYNTTLSRYIGSRSSTVNIYDNELNGMSYVTISNLSLYIGNEYSNGTKSYIGRIYAFIHNGAYYVDQRVHLYDASTLEEDTETEAYLTSLTYPNPLSYYCIRDPYTQPQTSYDAYPSYVSVEGDVNGVAQSYLTKRAYNVILNNNGTYEDNAVSSSQYTEDMLMMVPIEEDEFWEAESDFHTLHGGEAYART